MRQALIFLLLLIIQRLPSYSQESDKNSFTNLIGKVYNDSKDIGDPTFIMGYLLDPTNTDYKITLYRFSKTVFATFEQNTGQEIDGKIQWRIIDIVGAPKKTYFDHWCCKLVETGKYDRESFAFIKSRFILNDKVVKMYKADRKSSMFVEIREENCYKKQIKRIRGLKYK
jgi:hypothetical protein